MRRIAHASLFFSLVVLTLGLAEAALGSEELPPADHHAMIRLHLDKPDVAAFLAENHTHLDVAGGAPGEHVDVVARADELQWLRSEGIAFEIVQLDLETFYASRLDSRDNFGSYHSYYEALAWMDDLHAQYPQVISARWPIGQGHEGNVIYAFRVSDNPEQDEEGETEVLFDALHHAREVMGSEMVIMLAEYLGQQYAAGDPEIVALLDENEIYMVPMVNPDGFLYNEQIAPDGGGMWRKNRRNNGDGTFGVDNNRNYPYEWGCEWGSSGYPGDEDYRGPAPGSEPETTAMMAFINAHDFVTRQSFHSYGELTLYPWGYTSDDTPDEAVFREMAAAMVQYNGYTPGQPGDVLYDVCGGSIDWDYGEQVQHVKIFSFSNEIGDYFDGFWPPDSRRQALFEDNLWPALYMIAASDELRGPQFFLTPLSFTAQVGAAQTLTVALESFAGAAIDPATVAVLYRVDGGEFTTVPLTPTGQPEEFTGEIPGQAEGAVVEYYLVGADVDGNSGTSPRGAPDVLYSFEVGSEFTHAMEADRGWYAGAADDDAGTGLWVRVDPVGTSAQPEDDHSEDGTYCWVTGQQPEGGTDGTNDVDGGKTTLFSPIYDFTGAEAVAFSYWKWYSNDQGNSPGEDYWDVFVSNDAGATWIALEHTTTSTNAWVQQEFDLLSYVPEAGRIQVKFVASDEGSGSLVEAAVDDFHILGTFTTTAADDLPVATALTLAPSVPNPFNPMTTISFHLPQSGRTELGIYDIQGRLLKMLVSGPLAAGGHTITWNGRDALGRPLASGTYLMRLRGPGGEEQSRKLMLVR